MKADHAEILAAKQQACFIYDRERILANCARLQEATQGFELLYSVKANCFMPVVELLTGQGIGADAASSKEVLQAIEAGMDKDMIFYSAPAKSDEEIAAAMDSCTIIADSLMEVERLQELAAAKDMVMPIGIRLYPDFTMGNVPRIPSHFGMDTELLPELSDILASSPNLKLVGIHIHLKSQLLNAAMIREYWHNCYDLAEALQRSIAPELAFINFGSGIGVAYGDEEPIDLAAIKAASSEIVARNEASLKARLLLETGRYTVCDAGTYYTPILDIKTCCGRKYLMVANAINGFFRAPINNLIRKLAGDEISGYEPLYTQAQEFKIKVENDSEDKETVTIAGHLCTGLDTIAENIELNRAAVGDYISISNAGSYGYALSPLTFSGHEAPAEYLV